MMSAVILSLLLLSSQKPVVFKETIEFRVGERIITTTDIDLMVNTLTDARKKSGQPIPDQRSLRKLAVDALIEERLISQYLSSLSMGVSEREVENRINSIKTAHQFSSDQDLATALSKQGMTLDELRSQIRRDLEKGQFFQLLRRDVLSAPASDQELMTYYRNNLSQFQKSFEVELAECLIPAQNITPDLRSKIDSFEKDPTTFDTCVKNFSRGATATSGGKIGTFRDDILRTELAEDIVANRSKKVFRVSLPDAIQLLKVLKFTPLGPKSFEQAKEVVRAKLEQEKLFTEYQSKIASLKDKSVF